MTDATRPRFHVSGEVADVARHVQDGARVGLLSASQIAERVRRSITKRPSLSIRAGLR